MKPKFFDVTLRDGNQALKKPWNIAQKETIFRSLIEIGVHGIEVGFASASELDFHACKHLAQLSPKGVSISSLSRANEKEIKISWDAIQFSDKPRLHIVYPVSKFAIENILQIPYSQVIKNVVHAIQYAKHISNGKAEVQFSGEHFGDSKENLDFVIEVFQEAVKAGAEIINLPNTVERYRPFLFVEMVRKVKAALQEQCAISVHTHNDLGMATATTVESFFAGATQLETALNGLGERAGNTNFYEVACALHNSGIPMDIDFKKFYKTGVLVSELSGIPIPEKAPILGEDVFAHRSGIHQDGVAKTLGQEKNAYGAFDPSFVGRETGHSLNFTSQSGKSAIQFILGRNNINIDEKSARKLQPILKQASESKGGELTEEEILELSRFL